jgi:hypothetical protein
MVVVFSTCIGDAKRSDDVVILNDNGLQYAGSATCANCHQDIYKTHLNTAHFKTSGPANDSTIKGSFEPGKNIYEYNPKMTVVMEKRDGKFVQAGMFQGHEEMVQPFDMVIGSGVKGQTYLFWFKNILYQLPVSYYTPSNSWTNSPGYPNDRVLFDRSIVGRCLECHGTFFKKLSEDKFPVEYDKSKVIYGIDCERCHGPSKKHVDFQTENPLVKTAQYVINPAKLSRQQQLDACALCHSGLRKSLKPSFSFITGDTLDQYSEINYDTSLTTQLDVHSNQYGLLTASKCFRVSKVMTCSTCHNAHTNERGNREIFSMRCQSCHSVENHNFCKLKTDANILKKNCVDCHMPEAPSKVLTLRVEENKAVVPSMVRTHLIAVYDSLRVLKN